MPASPHLGSPNLFLKIQFWQGSTPLVPVTVPEHQRYWPHWGLGSCNPSKGSISIPAIPQGNCPCARLQHSPCPRLPGSKGLNLVLLHLFPSGMIPFFGSLSFLPLVAAPDLSEEDGDFDCCSIISLMRTIASITVSLSCAWHSSRL